MGVTLGDFNGIHGIHQPNMVCKMPQPDLVAEPGSYADAIYFVRGFRRARSQLLTQWSDTHIKSDEGDCACTGLHVREAYNILYHFIIFYPSFDLLCFPYCSFKFSSICLQG